MLLFPFCLSLFEMVGVEGCVSLYPRTTTITTTTTTTTTTSTTTTTNPAISSCSGSQLSSIERQNYTSCQNSRWRSVVLEKLKNHLPRKEVVFSLSQFSCSGWPTGNGKKLSSSQACCLAQLCLALHFLLAILSTSTVQRFSSSHLQGFEDEVLDTSPGWLGQ